MSELHIPQHVGEHDPVLKVKGRSFVFWPSQDPEAEEIIKVEYLVDFACKNESAFRAFLKAKRWN